MATSPSVTPTPITPPRVPFIDERTGLIDRAWYLFFLSLFRASETVDNSTLGTNTESLLASYDAALRALAQTTETQPPPNDCCTDALVVRQEVQSVPPTGVAELAQEVSDLRQEVQTTPRLQLGTFAALQQANLPWTTFDTTPESVPTDVGTVAWDGGTTLGIQMTPNVLQRVGETEFVYVKASASITKGQLCYHTGSVGSSGVITAAPTPIGLTDPNQIVGVAAESIALNGFGLIQISGDLRGFDTTGSSVGETWADGDPLYYNPAFVGSMTKVKPVAPNQKSYIGEVINAGSGGSGSMHIRIVQGSVLGGTDSNVQFGTLANNDLIQYSTTLGYWSNVTAASITVGTATNLAGGLAGSVPYQSAPSTTTFLSIGAANTVMTSSGTAPQWSTALTGLTGVSTTTATLSSNLTLNGGTANGVLYLNASRVATSGTAIVFDGSNLGIGTNSPQARLEIAQAADNTDGPKLRIANNGNTLSNGQLIGGIDFYNGDDSASGNAVGAYIYSFTNNAVTPVTTQDMRFATGGTTERMRLDPSGNLGIGTTSPQARLEIAQSANNTDGPKLRIANNGNTLSDGQLIGGIDFYNGDDSASGDAVGAYIYSITNNAVVPVLSQDMRFATGGTTERMRLDPSGNLGLGTSSFGTSAAKVLALGNATEPTTGPADTVQLYSVDRSAGNTIPAFYCEGSGVTNAGITSTAVTHKIAMKVNGTIYYLLATTNAT